MEDKSKKIEVINKLFTLAQGNENSGERLAAKAKAYALMNDYGILEYEIPFLMENDQSVPYLCANKNKVHHNSEQNKPSSLKKSVNLIKEYLKLFILVLWQILKIPLVWQSLFIIGYFALFIKLTGYLIATKQTNFVVVIFLGSIMLFGRWIKNFLVVLFFMAFCYIFYTSLYSYIETLFV